VSTDLPREGRVKDKAKENLTKRQASNSESLCI